MFAGVLWRLFASATSIVFKIILTQNRNRRSFGKTNLKFPAINSTRGPILWLTDHRFEIVLPLQWSHLFGKVISTPNAFELYIPLIAESLMWTIMHLVIICSWSSESQGGRYERDLRPRRASTLISAVIRDCGERRVASQIFIMSRPFQTRGDFTVFAHTIAL